MTPSLPPFLRPDPLKRNGGATCISAEFPHDSLKASSHSLWWPSNAERPDAILVFLPGNPGLVEFYTPFLSAIHEKTKGNLAILAHSHIGHTPGFRFSSRDQSTHDLTAQVAGAIEVVDMLKTHYGDKTKLIIAAHSVGTWIALQVLKARPDHIQSVMLLFPTILNIADSPKGQVLTPFFRPPYPYMVSCISVLTWLLPLKLLLLLFSDWPPTQVEVLRRLLHGPQSIYACLTMANDEMKTIRDLDVLTLQQYSHRMHLYFADQDGWLGNEQRNAVLETFEADPGAVKVVHGHSDVPHAFCINHGEVVAEQCFKWLCEGGFA